MTSPTKKRIIDANVPIIANQARRPSEIPDDLVECVLACRDIIESIVRYGGLVIDAGDEVFDEYRQSLSLAGQPGVGDRFVKWVHDHRWSFPAEDRVKITKKGNSYIEFPSHPDLTDFDISDHKYVAIANTHKQRPPIVQATDSKWWGWASSLAEVGIAVEFPCEKYISAKYHQKFGEEQQ